MNKREQLFRRVEEIKERIRNVPTEELVDRYNSGYLSKEGTFATREILDERGEAHLIGSRLQERMQMKATLYIVLLVLSGMVAMLFLYGAVYTIANHYLYFAPNKIAAEFEASVIFAGGYLLVALTAATVFLVLLRRFKRMKPA